MSERAVLDVSGLPDHAFGNRSIMWWATMCIIVIEGSVFILAAASYFYLQGNESAWPPPGTQRPDLFWATINLGVLLVSLIPNQLAKSASERYDIGKVRLWMVVADLFAVVFVCIRVLEFGHLNVSWDTNAYGSMVWTLLGFHSLHLITDLADSVVLTALMFTHHGLEGRRFVDVSENAFYWYFVVLSWIPLYGILYWAPRILS